MPITVQSELPEWQNLVTQVNALYKLYPEVAALRDVLAGIDKMLAIVQSDVASLKLDMTEVRRRLERIEWLAPPAAYAPLNWALIVVGLIVSIMVGAVLFWVVPK